MSKADLIGMLVVVALSAAGVAMIYLTNIRTF